MKRQVSWPFKAKLLRCVDGDTFDADVDLGFHVWKRVRFRLLDVDTPERGQPGFVEATGKLEQLLASKLCDGFLDVECSKTGKYGRWLGRVGDVASKMQAWMERQDWFG